MKNDLCALHIVPPPRGTKLSKKNSTHTHTHTHIYIYGQSSYISVFKLGVNDPSNAPTRGAEGVGLHLVSYLEVDDPPCASMRGSKGWVSHL